MSSSAVSRVPGWWRPAAPATTPAAAPAEDGRSRLPFHALLAFTFILVLAPQTWLPALAPLRIALLAAALAIGTQLLDRLAHRQPLVQWSRPLALAAALFAWGVLTVPFSYWPGGSVELLFGLFAKAVVVFWLIGAVVDTVPRLTRVAWVLSLMALPLALTALANFASGEVEDGGRIAGYDAGLTANPNDLALLLNLILPLDLALLLAVRAPAARAGLVALAVLDVAAIIATFSRAGFLTLLVTLGGHCWRSSAPGRRRLVLAALAVCGLGLALLPSGYGARLGTITDIAADESGSAQTRWSDMVAAAGYVASHPLIGAGAGMNALAMNEARGETWVKVHNVYLEYAVDLGLPGVLLFLWLLRECHRAAREGGARAAAAPELAPLRPLADGVKASLVAFAFAGLFHPVAYQFYFYIVGGLALGVHAAATATDAAPAKPGRR